MTLEKFETSETPLTDVREFIDTVATGQEFGKTPSTAKYESLGDYWRDGTEDEQRLKSALWDAYRLAPAPEDLQKYSEASTLYKKLIDGADGQPMDELLQNAVDNGTDLALSTIFDSRVGHALRFSDLSSDQDTIEERLYNGDQSAFDLIREAQLDEDGKLTKIIEMRKTLFEKVQDKNKSGFDGLSEVPFAGEQ